MSQLLSNPSSTDPAIIELRRRMDEFYARTTDYTAFQQTENRDDLYALLDPLIDEVIATRKSVRILELGAGRTGYPDYLQRRGVAFEFDAQDVTPANVEYLQPRCKSVLIGDINTIRGEYDLILSTFVLEHVTNPTEFLSQVQRLTAEGGWHCVFCPRYDLPGYLCPSLRHRGLLRRAATILWLAGSRLMSRLDGRPRFWVNSDPSMFHEPWFRDADAVHIVSRLDMERWHRRNGFEVRRLQPAWKGWRGWLLKRLLTVNLACRKLPPARGS